MKNILFILIACLMVTMVKAAPNAETSFSRRAFLIQFYNQQKQTAELGEAFLASVKKGDVQSLAELEARAKDGSYLMATDKFGNNAFHLAKDAVTVQAVARSIRHLYKDNFPNKILALKNQTNESGATPAVQAVLDLRPGKFLVLLDKSDLQQDILKVKSLRKGGALTVAAEAEQAKVVAGVQLADGYTAVDFARANSQVDGMDQVLAFFAENAPYL